MVYIVITWCEVCLLFYNQFQYSKLYACIYVCVYVCTCVSLYICLWLYACLYVYTGISLHIVTCIHTYRKKGHTCKPYIHTYIHSFEYWNDLQNEYKSLVATKISCLIHFFSSQGQIKISEIQWKYGAHFMIRLSTAVKVFSFHTICVSQDSVVADNRKCWQGSCLSFPENFSLHGRGFLHFTVYFSSGSDPPLTY